MALFISNIVKELLIEPVITNEILYCFLYIIYKLVPISLNPVFYETRTYTGMISNSADDIIR